MIEGYGYSLLLAHDLQRCHDDSVVERLDDSGREVKRHLLPEQFFPRWEKAMQALAAKRNLKYTPPPKTKQETFDAVLFGIRAQGKPSWGYVSGVTGGLCLYRGPNGLKCAAGLLLPDEAYKPSFENERVNGVDGPGAALRLAGYFDATLLNRLQNCHDMAASAQSRERFSDAEFIRRFNKAMQLVAEEYSLKYTPPDTDTATEIEPATVVSPLPPLVPELVLGREYLVDSVNPADGTVYKVTLDQIYTPIDGKQWVRVLYPSGTLIAMLGSNLRPLPDTLMPIPDVSVPAKVVFNFQVQSEVAAKIGEALEPGNKPPAHTIALSGEQFEKIWRDTVKQTYELVKHFERKDKNAAPPAAPCELAPTQTLASQRYERPMRAAAEVARRHDAVKGGNKLDDLQDAISNFMSNWIPPQNATQFEIDLIQHIRLETGISLKVEPCVDSSWDYTATLEV